MLIRQVLATAFGTNCWVVAPGPDHDCVVIDPGFGIVDGLRDVLAGQHLRPAAILLTHGHLDHVWSVVPVCATADPPPAVHIHTADAHRLVDPLATVDPRMVDMLAQQFPTEATWRRPADVIEATGVVGEIRVADMALRVQHTPGHTEGSVVFSLADGEAEGSQVTVFTGDLLFAGTIGRTDLPGGDPTAMTESLLALLAAYPDDTPVMPGHGSTTTIGVERARNPHILAALAGVKP